MPAIAYKTASIATAANTNITSVGKMSKKLSGSKNAIKRAMAKKTQNIGIIDSSFKISLSVFNHLCFFILKPQFDKFKFIDYIPNQCNYTIKSAKSK